MGSSVNMGGGGASGRGGGVGVGVNAGGVTAQLSPANFEKLKTKYGSTNAAFAALQNRATTDADRAAITAFKTAYDQQIASGETPAGAYEMAMGALSTTHKASVTASIDSLAMDGIRPPDPNLTVEDGAVASWFGEDSKIKTVHDLYLRYSANTKFNRMSEADFNALVSKYVNNADGSTERTEALEKLGPIVLTVEKQDASRKDFVDTLNAKYSNLATEFLQSRKRLLEMLA
jgi:hypothetical protein